MFKKVRYSKLNSRQKENYNFQKIAALLSDYGYYCLRLSDDWKGADFIACHIDGHTQLKVQLKGRMYIDKKYFGKGLQIAFPSNGKWYVYPHDEFLDFVLGQGKIKESKSWKDKKAYSWPGIPKWAQSKLNEYEVS